jgi:hypothetical protein
MGDGMFRNVRRTGWRPVTVSAFLVAVASAPAPGAAFDAGESFAKGTRIVSLQLGGGAQADIETLYSGITFLELTPRVSYLPFAPFGSGWYRTALEPGVEGWFEYYLGPKQAAAAGLKAALRLHALGFGRIVPYLELTAGAGGTGLRLPESQSTFTFILEGGAGASVFLTPALAITAGYRIQHLSNGGTSKPNYGFEANVGVVGLSFFFH